jgi:hypothetical protein
VPRSVESSAETRLRLRLRVLELSALGTDHGEATGKGWKRGLSKGGKVSTSRYSSCDTKLKTIKIFKLRYEVEDRDRGPRQPGPRATAAPPRAAITGCHGNLTVTIT